MNTYKEYIGDGVYVDFDGYQIWLSTDRGGVTHEIALEPSLLKALDHYRERLKQK